MTFISRRDLLKRAAAVAVVTPVARSRSAEAFALRDREAVAVAAGSADTFAGPENLTSTEMELLDAIVARLIPTDANGPGATEAMAAHYIDHALGGPLASSRQAYASGLAALDRFARSSHGGPFKELPPADQDAVLTAVESGGATGFTGSSAAFFAMVLGHTHQGTFGDPSYGGNANFVGWDLIGYPGVRTMVTAADQQRLESKTMKANHKSAYDYDFTKDAERGRGPAR
jgi:gluconate 2-dehydrogenase gamma chain